MDVTRRPFPLSRALPGTAARSGSQYSIRPGVMQHNWTPFSLTPAIPPPEAPLPHTEMPQDLADSRLTPKEKLAKFCDAIRAKENWVAKVLDESRGLTTKWAIEANLLKHTDDPNDDSDPVVQSIKDLKAEARRIAALDHTLSLDARNLTPRAVDFNTLNIDVRNAVKYARKSKYAIFPPSLKEEVGAFVSDGIIPSTLHRELVIELDALAAKEPKDFHPGTNGKVQDLIHPSLYPYVAGVSRVNDHSKIPPLQDGMFRTKISGLRDYAFESKYAWIPSIFRVSDDGKDVHIESYINGLGPRDQFPVLYNLIEKVFLIALPHFERTLEFDYRAVNSPSVLRWFQRSSEREGTTRANWEALLSRQKEEKMKQETRKKSHEEEIHDEMRRERSNLFQFLDADDSTISSEWRGQSLKVIVKAANYILQPGQEYEGTWHMEGLPHERIVASVIYYYDTDPEILDHGLGLRRLRDPESDFPERYELRHEDFDLVIKETSTDGEDEDDDEDEDEDEDEETESDYPSDWEEVMDHRGRTQPMNTSSINMYIGLGTVPTTNFLDNMNDFRGHGTGRVVSFPNWIQHKVERVKNDVSVTTPRVATRKILCFFLVEDDNTWDDRQSHHGYSYTGLKNMSVLTTADIPLQARGCNILTLRFLLPTICERLTGKNLPPELFDYIIDFADLGMTRELAEYHRRQLMEDRKIKREWGYSKFWDNSYSLCEH